MQATVQPNNSRICEEQSCRGDVVSFYTDPRNEFVMNDLMLHLWVLLCRSCWGSFILLVKVRMQCKLNLTHKHFFCTNCAWQRQIWSRFFFKFLVNTDGNTKISSQPAGCTMLLGLALGVSVSSFFLTQQCSDKCKQLRDLIGVGINLIVILQWTYDEWICSRNVRLSCKVYLTNHSWRSDGWPYHGPPESTRST